MGERTDRVDEPHQRVDELIDEYRAALHDSLNEVSDDEARRRALRT